MKVQTVHKIYLVLNNYCRNCASARPEICLCLWRILQHGAAHTPHTATWALFLFSVHHALHTTLRTVLSWVVMQRVVVRNYHYFLCYNPEELSSQLLLSRSLKSFTLPCFILYISCCQNIDWQVCLCQTWRILFI